MENFQGILGRVWIALKDCGPGQELQRQSEPHSKGKAFRGGCAGLQALAYRSFSGRQLRVTHTRGRDPSADHGTSKGKRRVGSEKENLTSQKDKEMVFEVSEFAAEPSTPNQSQGAVLWRSVNRTILHGFVKPPKSYLF